MASIRLTAGKTEKNTVSLCVVMRIKIMVSISPRCNSDGMIKLIRVQWSLIPACSSSAASFLTLLKIRGSQDPLTALHNIVAIILAHPRLTCSPPAPHPCFQTSVNSRYMIFSRNIIQRHKMSHFAISDFDTQQIGPPRTYGVVLELDMTCGSVCHMRWAWKEKPHPVFALLRSSIGPWISLCCIIRWVTAHSF